MIDWDYRWNSWSDEQIVGAIVSEDPRYQDYRHEAYAATILEHLKPASTLDIGGGTGELGKHLPGEYTVLDHPRMRQFTEAAFLPIGDDIGYYDLVVNTNCWGETDLKTVTSYIDQILLAGCPWLYVNNRKSRQVDFKDFPLDDWETVVEREVERSNTFIEFLGKRKWTSGS